MTFSLLYALLTEIEVILRLVDCESKTFGNNGLLFNGLKKKVVALLYELLSLKCLLFFVLSSLSPKHMAANEKGYATFSLATTLPWLLTLLQFILSMKLF